MKISIVTVFPDLYTSFLNTSLVARAQESGAIRVQCVAFSDVCAPKERIDESICGPGVGMVLKPEVVERALEKAQSTFGPGFKIFFSPQGTLLKQPLLRTLAKALSAADKEVIARLRLPDRAKQALPNDHIILICPRYEGMDTRVEEVYADLVLSIGDYVLMGGDVAAQVFLEGLLRLVPGVVGKWESVEHDSFSGPLLDYPTYGLPKVWHDQAVPDMVTSGNHGAIEAWRVEQATKNTLLKRFDWFNSQELSSSQRAQARQVIPPHYVALLHAGVLTKGEKPGTTSVTSIDLHDIARSCATYGIKKFFPVTPIVDQQIIVQTFLDFWRSEVGQQYNHNRFQAVELVQPMETLEQTIAYITQQEGAWPLLIATSAKPHGATCMIDYQSQGQVWQQNRPVLFLLGTGHGIAPEVLARCDYQLLPVNGLPDYNHLSVRSAAAIIFDRWLGLHTTLPPDRA